MLRLFIQSHCTMSQTYRKFSGSASCMSVVITNEWCSCACKILGGPQKHLLAGFRPNCWWGLQDKISKKRIRKTDCGKEARKHSYGHVGAAMV